MERLSAGGMRDTRSIRSIRWVLKEAFLVKVELDYSLGTETWPWNRGHDLVSTIKSYSLFTLGTILAKRNEASHICEDLNFAGLLDVLSASFAVDGDESGEQCGSFGSFASQEPYNFFRVKWCRLVTRHEFARVVKSTI